ncbi:DUF3221 domain-containing protein [Bacillus thuringiensis]|nr:DUF3221 domain-containing protein [Bacillus thuringiensis]MED2759992.1 DUF3221 domain-containing protein [Bacillus thuringiensis]MED2769486.1 DUF3221 domain-containing protein [Bacillus thuringiensis]MED2784011.1 DUF3221 domain-containing protein [Bacillus thuringiensis]
MKTLQSKNIITAASFALVGGFLLGGTLVSADTTPVTSSAVSSMNQMAETPYLTGYIVSINENYMTVIDAPTKEEAMKLQQDLYTAALQHKALLVPIQKGMDFSVGNKVSVFTKTVTKSIPAHAISPTIQKIEE